MRPIRQGGYLLSIKEGGRRAKGKASFDKMVVEDSVRDRHSAIVEVNDPGELEHAIQAMTHMINAHRSRSMHYYRTYLRLTIKGMRRQLGIIKERLEADPGYLDERPHEFEMFVLDVAAAERSRDERLRARASVQDAMLALVEART